MRACRSTSLLVHRPVSAACRFESLVCKTLGLQIVCAIANFLLVPAVHPEIKAAFLIDPVGHINVGLSAFKMRP